MRAITIFIVLIFISGCNSPKDSHEEGSYEEGSYMWNLIHYNDNYLKKVTSSLNLNSLEISKDSFEIRLYTKISTKRFGQILIIKKDEFRWNCYNYIYWLTSTSDIFDVVIDTFSVYRRFPKFGWNQFLDSLDRFKIFELPEQKDVEGWKDKGISDGITYSVEFKRDGNYGLFHYHCPDHYVEYWNSKQMNDFLNYLERVIDYNEYELPGSIQYRFCRKAKINCT